MISNRRRKSDCCIGRIFASALRRPRRRRGSFRARRECDPRRTCARCGTARCPLRRNCALFRRLTRSLWRGVEAYRNMLYMHAFTRDISPESECSLAENWEKIALNESERIAAHDRSFDYPPIAGRNLRLGVVSAELGQDPVAEFLQPILEQIDRSRFHVTLYPTARKNGTARRNFQRTCRRISKPGRTFGTHRRPIWIRHLLGNSTSARYSPIRASGGPRPRRTPCGAPLPTSGGSISTTR